MPLKERLEIFEKLGIFLEQFSHPGNAEHKAPQWLRELNARFYDLLESLIVEGHIYNPWFTEENVRFALGAISESLKAEELVGWLSCYDIPAHHKNPKTVAVIMAGNIPLVGFHDMLCVMISGHNIIAKLSAKDERFPRAISEIIGYLGDGKENTIITETGRIKDFDAVIATGSDNTSRYFEYYFGKYPNIIRKNRTSTAILDGSESAGDLEALADDIFRYFGLGCRSVSRILVPRNYDFISLAEAFSRYRHLADHNKWANNYEYQRALHLIDRVPHMDTGFMIIREDKSHVSPISVLNYHETDSREEAFAIIEKEQEQLQCVVGREDLPGKTIPFGKSQQPRLNEYADNIDTMEFLLKL